MKQYAPTGTVALALVAGLALVLGACATPGVAQRIVEVQEIRFELPGPEWYRDERIEASRVDIRRGKPGRSPQSIAMWPMAVPPGLRGLSVPEHASKYFDVERHLTRYEGRWEGFVEGEREIGEHRYPIMQVRVVYPDHIADDLFLLYFPEDFVTRQRFYVLMWQDYHLATEAARPLDELDAVVSSIRVKPLAR